MPIRQQKFTLAAIDAYRDVADAQIHPDASCVAFVVGALTHPRGNNPRATIHYDEIEFKARPRFMRGWILDLTTRK